MPSLTTVDGTEAAFPAKLAYSVADAARLTSLSEAHLRNEIRAERLKARKIGKRVLILAESLHQYLSGEGN